MVKLWEVLRGWTQGSVYRNKLNGKQVVELEVITSPTVFQVERGEELVLFRQVDGRLSILPRWLFKNDYAKTNEDTPVDLSPYGTSRP